MKIVERVRSDCGTRIIEVLRDTDGAYLLRKFSRRYDREEEKEYEIRELPDPCGRFGDLSTAIRKAKSLVIKSPS